MPPAHLRIIHPRPIIQPVQPAAITAENITDKTLINQFNRISELSEENKTVVSKLIDAFLFQQEMKQKLAQ